MSAPRMTFPTDTGAPLARRRFNRVETCATRSLAALVARKTCSSEVPRNPAEWRQPLGVPPMKSPAIATVLLPFLLSACDRPAPQNDTAPTPVAEGNYLEEI